MLQNKTSISLQVKHNISLNLDQFLLSLSSSSSPCGPSTCLNTQLGKLWGPKGIWHLRECGCCASAWVHAGKPNLEHLTLLLKDEAVH